jgi:hypothetical protein
MCVPAMFARFCCSLLSSSLLSIYSMSVYLAIMVLLQVAEVSLVVEWAVSLSGVVEWELGCVLAGCRMGRVYLWGVRCRVEVCGW